MDKKSSRQRVTIQLHEVRDTINAKSPTWCAAKWLQTTAHLHTGHTHSCHHPSVHKIPLKELAVSPKAIHNTKHKMNARQDMLDGIQTPECDYCWKIENLGVDHLSDRTFKSSEPWAQAKIIEAMNSGVGENIDPTYLEVSFESTCNFRCVYCAPETSSRWMEDVVRHGPYKINDWYMHSPVYLEQINKMPIDRNNNPYIDAFWEWWPDLLKTLQVFRITGGEPLLSKSTWRVLSYLEQNPQPNLDIAINSNLGVPTPLIDNLITSINKVHHNVKDFTVFTSLESMGLQAEYGRDGMIFSEFQTNVCRLLDETDTRLMFMTTINVLSVSTLIDFFDWVLELRAKYNPLYNSPYYKNRVGISINFIRSPEFMSIQTLPDAMKEEFRNKLYAYSDSKNIDNLNLSLYPTEIERIKAMADWMMETTASGDNKIQRDGLLEYVQQIDSRREKDFPAAFPDLISAYN